MSHASQHFDHDMNEPDFPSNHHVCLHQLMRKHSINFDNFAPDLVPHIKEDVVAHMEQSTLEIEVPQQKTLDLWVTMVILEKEVKELTQELQREVTPMMDINCQERKHVQWLCDIARDHWQMNFTRLKQTEFQMFHHQQFARAHFSSVMIR